MKKTDVDSVPLNELPAVLPEAYRDAMSHFAGAVHIATTDGVAGRRGVTISACCSLSDNPPTLLLCLMKSHEDNRLFIENGRFCINTLAGRHHALSEAFSGHGHLPQEERFARARWMRMKTGAPVLEDALAAFDCRLVNWHEHTTHYIIFGQVVGIRYSESKDALLYLNRGYHRLIL